jgi:nitroreductase
MIYNETINTILGRRSCLAYSDRKITDEEVETLYRAAAYAPTSGGRQPWHFTFIRDEKLLDEFASWSKEVLFEILQKKFPDLMNAKEGDVVDTHDGRAPKIAPKPFNREDGPRKFRFNAPMIAIVSGNKKLSGNYYIDCCLATENMYIAAESLGMKSLWWGTIVQDAIYFEKAKPRLGELIPEGYDVVSVSLVGYPEENFEEIRRPGRKVGFVRGEGGLTLR